jgi:hypothetical protein
MKKLSLLCTLLFAAMAFTPTVFAQEGHVAVNMLPGEFRYVMPQTFAHVRGTNNVPGIRYSLLEIDKLNGSAGVGYLSLFDPDGTPHAATIRADVPGSMSFNLLVEAQYPDGNGKQFTLRIDVLVVTPSTAPITDDNVYLEPFVSWPVTYPPDACIF